MNVNIEAAQEEDCINEKFFPSEYVSDLDHEFTNKNDYNFDPHQEKNILVTIRPNNPSNTTIHNDSHPKKSRLSFKNFPFNLAILEIYQMLLLYFQAFLSLEMATITGKQLKKWLGQELKKLLALQPVYEALSEKQKWFDQLRYFLSQPVGVAKNELEKWLNETSSCPSEIKIRLSKYWDQLFTYSAFPGLHRDTSNIERSNGVLQRSANHNYWQCGQNLDIFGEILLYSDVYYLDTSDPPSIPFQLSSIDSTVREQYKVFRCKSKELEKERAFFLEFNRKIATTEGKEEILHLATEKWIKMNL